MGSINKPANCASALATHPGRVPIGVPSFAAISAALNWLRRIWNPGAPVFTAFAGNAKAAASVGYWSTVNAQLVEIVFAGVLLSLKLRLAVWAEPATSRFVTG